MSNDELIYQVFGGVSAATVLAHDSWTRQAMSHQTSVRLRDALSSALAAAQELERRAAGAPPPKVGD